MQLTLCLISPQPGPGQVPVKTFNRCGGHVGRGADNDWVLLDPERRLSKSHFAIDYADGGYWLIDTSTNGVYLNHSLERVPRGGRVALAQGDLIRCADYEIEVQLAEEGMATDTFLAVLTDQPPAPASLPPTPASRPATAGPCAGHNLPLPEPVGDELGGFIAAAAHIPEDDSLFGAKPPPDRWDQPPQPDHLAAEQQFFAAPRPVQQIPDDWLAEATSAPPPPEPQPEPPLGAATEPPVEPSPIGDDALWRAFLAGAGIEPESLRAASPDAALRQAGRLFRLLVEGVRAELAGRAAIKSEFRMEQTVLRPLGNNPLKFSASPDDAVRALLQPGKHGVMPADPAAAEAFDDLKRHQIAMLAGMQAAIASLVRRFDPDSLEARIGTSAGLLSRLGGGGKSRYWEAFRELYGTIAAEVEDDFHRAFDAEFEKAYRQAEDDGQGDTP